MECEKSNLEWALTRTGLFAVSLLSSLCVGASRRGKVKLRLLLLLPETKKLEIVLEGSKLSARRGKKKSSNRRRRGVKQRLLNSAGDT